ncbi:N-acetylmuramoyl-L-alanine amidase [Hydrogenovibrio halophilus]|uniref:N-acetylmuramoyl-L-alanine amidase n=1 Tax=Hydrogenovibrio halophilus TaxID=373391 RepID=UPI0003763F41|nr:N-acetylmuramoyl-L-alanine amidase [Hydrogenovibrio halophilus]
MQNNLFLHAGSARPNRSSGRLKRWLVVLMALVGLLSLSSQVMADTTLTKVRFGQGPDHTRVVFEIKQNQTFKVWTLDNPARIVLDFYGADNGLGFERRNLDDKRLQRIRVKNQTNRTRVVLDLKDALFYEYFTLAARKGMDERVVVDLKYPVVAMNRQDAPKQLTATKKPAAKKADTPKAKPAQTRTASRSKLENAASTQPEPEPQATRKLLKEVSESPRELVVALDPGHGGFDTGAIARNGVYEKHVILSMAKRIKKRIDAAPGMRAVLTRTSDRFLPLKERVRLAQKQDADIFISLHADAFGDERVRGGSAYILAARGAGARVSSLLKTHGGNTLQDVRLKTRADRAYVLTGLSRAANIRASRKLANALLSELGVRVHMHKRQVQTADFAVLKSIDMPSILLETAFISNAKDLKNLQSPWFHNQMGDALVRGLQRFVSQHGDQPRWGEQLYVQYRVRPGDTLSQIAANYQLTTHQLKKINHIQKADRLYVGKRLKIPVSDTVLASL